MSMRGGAVMVLTLVACGGATAEGPDEGTAIEVSRESRARWTELPAHFHVRELPVPEQVGSLEGSDLIDLIDEAERARLHQSRHYAQHSDHGPELARDISRTCIIPPEPTDPETIECHHRGCGDSCYAEEIDVQLVRTPSGWTVTRFEPNWHDMHHGCGICEPAF
jgi:hypothetical protein